MQYISLPTLQLQMKSEDIQSDVNIFHIAYLNFAYNLKYNIMSFFSNLLNNSGILKNSKIMEDYGRLFLEEEQIEVGFKLNEDAFLFTSKRLIFVEVTKGDDSGTEYFSLPYSQISSFSEDSKKSFDPKGVLKIWINGQQYPTVETEFNKSVDVYEVQKILAGKVMK